MKNEDRKIDTLLKYLSELSRLNSMGYICTEEIDECVEAIRKELKIEEERTYYDLSEVLTKDLSEELAKREGVTEYVLEPGEELKEIVMRYDGPARVLINRD